MPNRDLARPDGYRSPYGAGVVAALEAIDRLAARLDRSQLTGSREMYRAMVSLSGAPPVLHSVVNRTINGPGGQLTVRLYRPKDGICPAVLFLHGGWFIMGGLDTHDAMARSLALATGYMVVAVDYRLAPEHPCPAAVTDCSAALEWLAANADALGIDAGRLAVCGDSAGGALAAVVARRARDAGGPHLRMQILIYPVINPTLDTPSWHSLTDAPIVSRARAELAWSMYLPPGSAVEAADAAPSAAVDLTGLPPALVITAEHDPLRDEGEAYATSLADDGVAVCIHRYPGMIHGFAQMNGLIPAAADVFEEIANALRLAFH